MPQPREVAFERIGNWDTVFYDMGSPAGTNSHVRAHWVQAETWIDVHISVTTTGTAAANQRIVAEER